jgi:hypothetical protein
MKNWKYNELIATYYNAYFSLVEQGVDIDQANNRNVDDFWFYPEEENIVPNLISIILYLKIQISFFKKVQLISIELFNKQLSLINEEILNGELDLEEIELLKESIEEIQIKLRTTPNF